MDITVNGKSHSVGSSMSLESLLETLPVVTGQSGIAVCINGEVVRRADWPRIQVNPADEVEIVQAAQGG